MHSSIFNFQKMNEHSRVKHGSMWLSTMSEKFKKKAEKFFVGVGKETTKCLEILSKFC